MANEGPAWIALEPFVPDHVDPALVRTMTFAELGEGVECPYQEAVRMQAEGEIFWDAHHRTHGGAWVPTKAEDIRFVTTRTDLFSTAGETGFSGLLGEDWPLIPLEIDPPEHTAFRKAFNHLIAPPAVEAVAGQVHDRAVSLIEAVRPNGGCEFMSSFGFPFPVGVFLSVMGLPLSRLDEFVGWGHGILNGASLEERANAAFALKNFINETIDDRLANPVDDVATKIVHSEINGRPITRQEMLGSLFFIFIGGIDTVASTMSFAFHYLAQRPDVQKRLRENPDRIANAVEEFMRRFSVVTASRKALQDVELAGQTIKKGDWVALVYPMGSLDPREFDCPMDIDLDRKNVRHFGFGFGPHFCMGSHLARREMRIAFHEWLQRIPEFRLASPDTGKPRPGAVFGIDTLQLAW